MSKFNTKAPIMGITSEEAQLGLKKFGLNELQ